MRLHTEAAALLTRLAARFQVLMDLDIEANTYENRLHRDWCQHLQHRSSVPILATPTVLMLVQGEMRDLDGYCQYPFDEQELLAELESDCLGVLHSQANPHYW